MRPTTLRLTHSMASAHSFLIAKGGCIIADDRYGVITSMPLTVLEPLFTIFLSAMVHSVGGTLEDRSFIVAPSTKPDTSVSAKSDDPGQGTQIGQATPQPPPEVPSGGRNANCRIEGGNAVCGKLTSPNINASVNKTLLVTAPPYNAKCDGTTDDHGAIQAAFDDALTSGQPIQFPAGTCMTSTIVWKGQSFFGAGRNITYIKGMPGQDVFQTPDNVAHVLLASTTVHDLNIVVDASVNAAATNGGGNNKYSNRVAGTLQGLTPFKKPISPGPSVFGYGLCRGKGVNATAAQNTVTFTCTTFPTGFQLASLDPALVIGAPITITGAGESGGIYKGTITGITSGCAGDKTCVISVNPPINTTVTNAPGTMLNPMTPPWYIGNAGLALQCSDGDVCAINALSWNIFNVEFDQTPSTHIDSSRCAGIFTQVAMYGGHFEKLYFNHIYAGYIEAAPFSGRIATGDTSSFQDIDFFNQVIPIVTYNGNDRVMSNINIYAELPLAMGPFFLTNNQISSGNNIWTINSIYMEGGTQQSGEIARFMSGPYHVTSANMFGSSAGMGYTEFAAWSSNWDGSIPGGIHVDGNTNYFRNTGLPSAGIVDNGQGNTFENVYQAGAAYYQGRRSNPSRRPFHDPVGKLDGTFVVENSGSPYLSTSDLFTFCADWAIANNPAFASKTGGCVPDPDGEEVTRTYFHSAASASILELGGNGGPNNIWSGTNANRLFGTHVPLTKVTIYVQARCVGASTCSAHGTIKDGTTNASLGSASLKFGSSWTTQSWIADLTKATIGDVLDFRFDEWLNQGTNYDIAWIGIQPWPVDTAMHTMLDFPPLASAASFGSITNLLARDQVWRGIEPINPAVDTSSPTGYSISLSATAARMFSYRGSTDFPGGEIFPANYGQITWTVQAPPVWTDSLRVALTDNTTDCELSSGARPSWQANGFFIVDEEIIGYSGTPPVGEARLTCARGQFGTIARAHSAKATVSSVAAVRFVTTCNDKDVSNGREISHPLLGKWTQVSQAFAGQGCSGYTPSFNTTDINAPSGQVIKIANLQVVSLTGVQSAPTAANQTMCSVELKGGSWYVWQDKCAFSPMRAGTWSITGGKSSMVKFTSAMSNPPSSCSVTPSASAATTGIPFATSLSTTGFTVNVPNVGALSGTYQCVLNNGN